MLTTLETAQPSLKIEPQFKSASQQLSTVEVGMWTFLLSELMLFGAPLCGYVYYRVMYPSVFALASKHNELVLGTLNTAILLTSSFTMAVAVWATHHGRRRMQISFLATTSILGAIFLGIKFYEYFEKYRTHLWPGRGFAIKDVDPHPAQLFFLHYVILTGIHALHLLVAVTLVGLCALMTLLSRRFRARQASIIHAVGLYWHLVDVVWVFLYPLFYLVNS